MGNDCGTVVGTCGVNLFNGNLVVSFRTPAGGPSDPPIRCYYNSQSTAEGEYGFGWSGLYQQWIQSAEPCCILARLCRIQNPAGKSWTIQRDTSDPQARVTKIVDALDEEKVTTFAYDGSHKLASVTDPAGRVTSFTVDTAGDLVRVRHADTTETEFEYDDNHLLSRWINPEGDCVTFTYHEDTRLHTIETPDNGVTVFDYDDESQQRKITDGLGNVTTITLDPDGNIKIVEYHDGGIVTYTWDSTQRLVSIAETPDATVYTTYFGYDEMDDHSRSLSSIDRPIGGITIDYETDKKRVRKIQQSSGSTPLVTTLTWDDYTEGPTGVPGKLSQLTNAAGDHFDYTYTALGQLETITDPLEHVMTWSYDAQGRRISIQNPLGERTTFTYSDNSQVETVTNAESETTTYDRDPLNRLLTTSDPLSHTTTLTYDANGRIEQVSAPMGRASGWTYRADGRVQTQVDAESHTTAFAYDLAGNLKTITSPLGHVTTNTYDELNRLLSVEDPVHRKTTYKYDKSSNLTVLTNSASKKWTYTYDGNHRLRTEKDPKNHVTTYAYDSLDKLVSVTNALGFTTTTTYDVLERVWSVEDPLGNTTTNTYDEAGRLVNVENPLNQVTTYAYDNAGRLRSVEDALSHKHTYTYDAVGRQLTGEDPLGHVVTMAYDAGGRLSTVQDALGQVTTYEYDNADRLTVLTAPGQVISLFGYDRNDRLITVTKDPVIIIAITTTTYDDDGNIETVRGPVGEITAYSYTDAGQVESVVDPINGVTTYTYDAANNLYTVESAEGYITTHLFDEANRPWKVQTPGDGSALTTEFHFDAAHRLEWVKTPSGIKTTYQYDPANRLTDVTNGENEVTHTDYDEAGHVVRQINPRLLQTTYTYDDAGRLESVRLPTGFLTTYVYDAADRMINVVEPPGGDGRTTVITYDAIDRVSTISNPNGETTTITYNASARTRSVTAPGGSVTTYVYDRMLNLVSITNPLGKVTTMVYDRSQRLLATTDSESNTTTLAYDAAGRVIRIVDAEGRTTTNTYDADSLLDEIIDPKGHVTSFDCDGDGRLTTVSPPSEYSTINSYDEDGRLKTVMDANGDTTSFSYDRANRLRVQELPGGSFHYSYDENGNLETVADPNGTSTFSYDDLDRIETFEDRGGRITTYGYDSRGFMTTAAVSGIGTFTYGRDEVGRLISITAPDSGVTTLTYDSSGRPKTRVLPGGITVSMSYDSAGNLKVLEHVRTGGGCKLARYEFEYNDAGIRELMTDDLGREISWTYDATYQLTSEVRTGGLCWNTLSEADWYELTACELGQLPVDTQDVTHTYGYDDAGNMDSFDDGVNPFAFAYNNDDVLETITNVNEATVTTFAFDRVGQRVSMTTPDEETTEYSWNREHRLVSVALPGSSGTVTYTYDANGLLVRRQSGSGAWRYLWEGNRLLAVYNESTDQLTWFVRVTSPFGNLIQRTEQLSGDTVFPLADPFGSATKIVTPGQLVIRETEYSAFGELLHARGSSDPTIQFVAESGYYRDPDTGLYYLRQRWYDPLAKRFLSPDPLGKSGRDPNLFRYAGNNPINNSDPEGLDYVSARKNQAFWTVQYDAWGPYNPDVETLYLGAIIGAKDGSDGSISLTAEFGNGSVGHADLRRAADTFWNQYSDLTNFTRPTRVKIIQGLLSRIQTGTYREAPSAASVYTAAIASGVKEGAAIQADALTFGLVGSLNRYAIDLRSEGGVYTASSVLGIVARETLFAAATFGTGAIARGGVAGIVKAAPTLCKALSVSGNSQRMVRAAKYTNWGLRGFEAGQTMHDAQVGIKAVSSGNPWGWLAIGTAGLSGFTAAFGGYGFLRKLPKYADEGDAVVHLTDEAGKTGITASQKIFSRKGFVSGLDAQSVPRTTSMRTIATWSTHKLTQQIEISGDLAKAFKRPVPLGPLSLSRRMLGVRTTGLGYADLASQRFVEGWVRTARGTLRPATKLDQARYYLYAWVNMYASDTALYAGALYYTSQYAYLQKWSHSDGVKP